jgi:7-carboxy-7-deazaguanine synthase
MSKFNKIENTQFLTKKDEVKFVVLNKDDFDWAVNLINQQKLFEKVDTILISPVFGKLEYVSLANWILSSGLPLKMQLQIHKFIWHPETRGV